MPTKAEERAAAMLARHVASMERLSSEMWRNALAEAAVAVVRAKGTLALEDLLSELRRMGVEKPRVKLNEHAEITIETRTSETAIEHLTEALAVYGEKKPK